LAIANGGTAQVSSPAGEGNYTVQLALIVALFGGIGFITAMNDVLVPHFKDLFHLTNVKALLVQFAFFGAYFLLAIPSGKIVARIGYRWGMIASMCVIGCGLLLFLPASIIIAYPLFLFALFVVGCGLALLQVAVNPYISALGDPARAASRLNLAGGLNSVGGTLAPRVGAMFIFIAAGASEAELAHSVRMPYVILGLIAFAMALVTWLVPLPEIVPQTEAGEKLSGSAWNFRQLRFGLFGIFFYVGAEVTVGSLIINYLGQPSMGGMSHLQASKYVSLYWAGAMVMRFIGFVVLRHVKQSHALAFVSAFGVLAILIAIFGHGAPAMWAIVSCGLYNSVMWPCIFPMSIEGLGKYTSQGSGLLVTMIVGGAVIPEIQGFVADHHGYQASFLVVLVCYLYVLFFAVNGHKPGKSVEGLEGVTPAVV
jgi:FHS family L-fucose permease-like MFS transporter